jgi:hypothetical protein
MVTIADKFFGKKESPVLPNEQIEEIVKKYAEGGYQYKANEMLTLYEIAKPKGMLDFRAWKYKLMVKYSPLATVLINMQLTTGEHISFIVKIKEGGFVFDKGFYIIDDKMKYYNISAKLWCFDYHEELCFPISRIINITNVKNALIKSEDVELETAINPVSLNSFMQSTVIQKLLQGAELEDSLKFMKLMIIINAVIGVIVLLLSIKNAGLFGK